MRLFTGDESGLIKSIEIDNIREKHSRRIAQKRLKANGSSAVREKKRKGNDSDSDSDRETNKAKDKDVRVNILNGEVKREQYIQQMQIVNRLEKDTVRDKISVARKNGRVELLDMNGGNILNSFTETLFEDTLKEKVNGKIIKEYEYVGLESNERHFATCTNMGNVRVQKWDSELQDGDENGSNAGFTMKLGVDMCKMRAKDVEASILAFGGNEQELRIYDINKVEFGDTASGANNGAWRKPKSEPLFKAKNIADDYLGLRNPVWITDIDFLDKNENTTNSMGNKLVVSTGYGFIRTYDTLAQKKPVLNLNVFNENRNRKITNIAVSPNQYDVFFTDNSGIICQLDLRKATSSSIDFAVSTNQNKTPFIVESYKGATGAVTSMAVVGQTDGLFLATVSLDRFFRLYRINIGSTYKHSKMIHQTYLKQRMSAVCWDSTRSIYNSDDIVQQELDEVWDKIDTVH